MQSLDLELWWRRQRSGSVCAENILSSWWFHMISFSTPTRIHERPQFFWKRQQHLNKTNIPEKQCSIQKKKRRMFLRRRQPPAGSFFPWIKISKRKLIQPCDSLPALAELSLRNRLEKSTPVSLGGTPVTDDDPADWQKRWGLRRSLMPRFWVLGLGIIKCKPHFGIKNDASRW